MSEVALYSCFEKYHQVLNASGKKQWVTELVFFKGDLSKVNCQTDDRFKMIEGKRDQMEFLGMANISFPVKYPLIFSNGFKIGVKNYYHKSNTPCE